jgi:succinyl-CoA synthetase beta subunit
VLQRRLGADSGGLAAVAELGARVGDLLLENGLSLLELNPVSVSPAGAVVALDAVARTAGLEA